MGDLVSYFSRKFDEEERKKLFWKFIDELRELKKSGAEIVTPEIVSGIIHKIVSRKRMLRKYYRISHRYFKYFVNIAVKMGFLEERSGLRGWILTEKLLTT